MIDVENLRETADEMLSGLNAGEAMRCRIALQSNALERLPSIAGEVLGGLKADSALRHRIVLAAQRSERADRPEAVRERPLVRRLTPVAALAMALVLVIGLGVFYSGDLLRTDTPLLTDGIYTYASSADGAAAGVSQYRSLFSGTEENPPLLLVNGRYYRMLESPASVPASLLDSAITQVQTVVENFAGAGTLGVSSNVAASGAKIYSISGLSTKTALAAEVQGALRIFQRVSYNDSALVGEESFEDTLDVMSQVAALELSGVGVVADVDAANELIYMLTEGDFTAWYGEAVGQVSEGLTIYLENGLSLQLSVSGDVLSACGAWSCPEFFEAFKAAL